MPCMSCLSSSAMSFFSLTLEAPQPFPRRRRVQRLEHVFADDAVIVYGLCGQVCVSAVPGIRVGHLVAPLCLEACAVTRALTDQTTRLGKIDGVRPDGRQARRRFVDEVVEVVLPDSVEVADEEQPPTFIDHRPVREEGRSC